MNGATTDTMPMSHHLVPGAILRNTPTESLRPARPKANSASITGMPNTAIHTMYSNRKAAPPLSAVSAGKRQILPKPTAEPTVAANSPNFEAN